MKALTLWQPWASLVAWGVKTIETRSWSTDYGGPLAIHAAAKRPPHGGCLGDWYVEPWWYAPRHVIDCCCEDGEIDVPCARRSTPQWVMTDTEGRRVGLPLGVMVATCELVDVVPVVDPSVGLAVGVRGYVGDCPHEGGLLHQRGGLWLFGPAPGRPTRIEDQRPYGNYEPGRYAWVLQNVKRLREPIRVRGRQRLWNWTEAAA